MPGFKLRWGIAGAGRICSDFVAAVKLLPSDDHQVVAVAARELDRARSFADQFSIPKAFDSYDALRDDLDVDIVYVGVYNLNHKSMCESMLTHGKHVLCEKPLTLHLEDTRYLVELAKKHNRFLLEGIWSRCFPAYKRLREELDKNTVGDISLLMANYGLSRRYVANLVERSMGGGILYNVGCYVIQLATFVFRDLKLVSVKASATLNSTGADETTAITLQYNNGAIAQFLVSLSTKMDSTARIVGALGEIQLPGSFIAPLELKIGDKVEHFPVPEPDSRTSVKKSNYTNSSGLSYQAEEARQCIMAGLIESSWMSHEDSIRSAEIMEEIARQIGLKYD